MRRTKIICTLGPATEKTDVLRQLIQDRKSTRLNSSHSQISYAVFCLKKKNKRLPSGWLKAFESSRARASLFRNQKKKLCALRHTSRRHLFIRSYVSALMSPEKMISAF